MRHFTRLPGPLLHFNGDGDGAKTVEGASRRSEGENIKVFLTFYSQLTGETSLRFKIGNISARQGQHSKRDY